MSKTPRKSSKARRWSSEVTKHSDALDLKPEVFKGKDSHRIALSLTRSAERSKRRIAGGLRARIRHYHPVKQQCFPFQSHASANSARVSSTPARQTFIISSSSRW